MPISPVPTIAQQYLIQLYLFTLKIPISFSLLVFPQFLNFNPNSLTFFSFSIHPFANLIFSSTKMIWEASSYSSHFPNILHILQYISPCQHQIYYTHSIHSILTSSHPSVLMWTCDWKIYYSHLSSQPLLFHYQFHSKLQMYELYPPLPYLQFIQISFIKKISLSVGQ